MRFTAAIGAGALALAVGEVLIRSAGQDEIVCHATGTYALPAFATTYRVNFIVSDKKNGGLYQEASTTNSTRLEARRTRTLQWT